MRQFAAKRANSQIGAPEIEAFYQLLKDKNSEVIHDIRLMFGEAGLTEMAKPASRLCHAARGEQLSSELMQLRA